MPEPWALFRTAAALLLVTITAQPAVETLPARFEGRTVTITIPEQLPNGFETKGTASVCIEGPPVRQCFTPRDNNRVLPAVEIVSLKPGLPALLFSAAYIGASMYGGQFALLRPGPGNDLINLLSAAAYAADQSQHAFWSDRSISDTLIFVNANYVMGTDESHSSAHRYMISAYVFQHSFDMEQDVYSLYDSYLTLRRYKHESTDILAAEKPEILKRLRQVKHYLKAHPLSEQ